MSQDRERLVEIRSYRLQPGTGKTFDRLVDAVSVPMLRASGTDVVAYGPSLHDPDAYVLIRAYESAEERAVSQQAFYGSQAWKSGPREAIVSMIVHDIDVLVWLMPTAIEGLRRRTFCRSPSEQRDGIAPR